MYVCMYLCTKFPHPHGHRQLQELLGNQVTWHTDKYEVIVRILLGFVLVQWIGYRRLVVVC